jgi:hypothetical protein
MGMGDEAAKLTVVSAGGKDLVKAHAQRVAIISQSCALLAAMRMRVDGGGRHDELFGGNVRRCRRLKRWRNVD